MLAQIGAGLVSDLQHLLSGIGWMYSLSGLAVGFIVGMTGVGGGSLMTPLLVLMFGFHPANAVGTDLLYAALTKSGGTAVHHIGGSIEWRIMGLLAAGSVPATLTTLLILRGLDIRGAGVGATISTVLGIALLLTALSLIYRRAILDFGRSVSDHFLRHPRRQAAATVALGATLGVLVSISSVGAGALGVTVLLLLYPNLPTVRIVGTDIAHAVPLTLIAGIGYSLLGSVYWDVLVSLLIGSLPGIVIGSLLAPRISERLLRVLLAAVLAIVGLRLVLA
jgi:uncharacterized membrane protein YfcA